MINPTIMHSKELATDILALHEIGVDTWKNSFFWPVSDREFSDIVNFVYTTFDNMYDELDPEDQALVLSDNSFLTFLIQHIHASAVRVWCGENDVRLVLGPLSKSYYDPDWRALAEKHKKSISVPVWILFSKQIRRLSRNIKVNNHLGFLRRLAVLYHPDVLGMGSVTKSKLEYARRNQLAIDHSQPEVLLAGCDFSNGNLDHEIEREMKKYLDAVDGYVRTQFQIRLDKGNLFQAWSKRLNMLKAAYRFLHSKKLPADVFIASSEANAFHRIFSHMFQEQGEKSIALHHGSSMGGWFHSYAPYNYLASYSHFYCPTKGCAESWERNYLRTPFGTRRRPVFQSMDSDYYRKIWERCSNTSLPGKIKKVMIMGFPMNAWRYTGLPYNFFAFQLEISLQLIEFLKRAGYEVLYKIHPDRLEGALELFSEVCDRVLVEPFEDVWEQADTFVLTYTATTTMGFALCTNRPIILLDSDRHNWNPDHYDLLRRRCRVVSTSLEETNRILFDRDELLAHLAARPEEPDYTYVKTFMFPDNEICSD